MRGASVTWLGALVGLGLGAATGQPALAAENLRLCTGAPGKAYIKVGQKLAELAPRLTAGALTIEVVPTAGSLDNLAKAAAGECDAFISQGDAIDFFTRQLHPEAKDSFQVAGELYKELTLLLCRRDSGIDDLDEARGKVVAAGSMGTGSLATLLNLQQLAPDSYGEIKINPTNGFEGAMAVVNGQAQCLLDVIAPQSDLVKTLNDNERTGTQLYFAEIDNDDLEDTRWPAARSTPWSSSTTRSTRTWRRRATRRCWRSAPSSRCRAPTPRPTRRRFPRWPCCC